MSAKEGKLLSLAEAAEISKYEASALRRLAIKGNLPAQKIGKQWVISRAKLDKWMASEDYHPGKGQRHRKPDG